MCNMSDVLLQSTTSLLTYKANIYIFIYAYYWEINGIETSGEKRQKKTTFQNRRLVENKKKRK